MKLFGNQSDESLLNAECYHYQAMPTNIGCDSLLNSESYSAQLLTFVCKICLIPKFSL